MQMLGNGLEHIIRRIRRGDQAVNGVGVDRMLSAPQLPAHKVRGVTKNLADIFVGHRTGIMGYWLLHLLTSRVV